MVAVAAGEGLLSAGVAHAGQAPPNLGALTFNRATGIDTSPIEVRTSGGCPTPADGYSVGVSGPNNFNFVIVATTSVSFGRTEPLTVPFGQTMKDAGELQVPPVPLAAGAYDVTLTFQRGFPPAMFGTYTGELIFTSPTAYRTGAAVTTTTTAPTGDWLALSPAVEPPPVGTSSVAGPPNGAARDQAASASTASPQPDLDAQPPSEVGRATSERTDATGQAVLWLVLGGAVVVFLVVVAVANRIRRRPSS